MMGRRITILILFDLVLIFFSFYLAVALKEAPFTEYFYGYQNALLFFSLIWLVASVIGDKFIFIDYSYVRISTRILQSNAMALAFIFGLIFFTRSDSYSRFIVFTTIALISFFELLVFNTWATLKRTKILPDDLLAKVERSFTQGIPKVQRTKSFSEERIDNIREALLSEYSQRVYSFLEERVDIFSDKTLLLSTATPFNIKYQPDSYFCAVVNLKRVNDIRWINKFFESVNQKLSVGGQFVCVAEIQEQRKRRLLAKYPVGLNYIYYFFDFILKRVFPKFSWTKKIYFFLTRGQNRVISRAELLGRLYSCGFKVVTEEEIDRLYYVLAEKCREPFFDMEPTYGPLIKLRRVGKGGKIIKVFKLRTMHPYSEYLQEYIYEKHSLQEGGKFKNDFRISTLGRILRKFWLDEFPMLFNLLKGDLKLVGVRPLSMHYFNLYTEELKKRRVRYKPGLIPPFYVDYPKTLEEIMESEIRYLDSYDKHPLITDMRYFFVALYNIVFRSYRSR